MSSPQHHFAGKILAKQTHEQPHRTEIQLEAGHTILLPSELVPSELNVGDAIYLGIETKQQYEEKKTLVAKEILNQILHSEV